MRKRKLFCAGRGVYAVQVVRAQQLKYYIVRTTYTIQCYYARYTFYIQRAAHVHQIACYYYYYLLYHCITGAGSVILYRGGGGWRPVEGFLPGIGSAFTCTAASSSVRFPRIWVPPPPSSS